jgi:hypothetical protein
MLWELYRVFYAVVSIPVLPRHTHFVARLSAAFCLLFRAFMSSYTDNIGLLDLHVIAGK